MVKKEDLEAAKSVARKLEETLQDKLIRVVLFGSRARGDANKDSDFDFLVVGEFTEPSWPKRCFGISTSLGYLGYPVDYIPVTEEEFEHKLLIRKAIKKEGIVLYERGHKVVVV